MPELPDVTVYVERLRARTVATKLLRVRLASPFILRTVDPPLSATFLKRVSGVRRLGKRIVIALEGDLFLVLHLMIAGRLRWRDAGAAIPGKIGHGAFDFDEGTLLFTEASTKKRASLHVVAGEAALSAFDRGGAEPLDLDLARFRAVMLSERHTLKRSLTDPRLFSGIGNAYSDEILHRARLSPVRLSDALDDGEMERLFQATQGALRDWTERLRAEVGAAFPEKVTAFREGMAVHGRFGEPCPVCGARVQRITYAESETNYCARCQNAGRLLADRSLSRLMKDDWPRTLDDLEEGKARARALHIARTKVPGA